MNNNLHNQLISLKNNHPRTICSAVWGWRLVPRPAQCAMTMLTLLLLTFVTFGQNARNTDYSPDKSLKSNARVNPSTLAMELSVPIAGYPGRAGNNLPVSFEYSSKVWEIETIGSWMSQYGVRTDTRPTFAKRTAAGWSSNLGSPRIDYKYDFYDGSDHPSVNEGGYVGQVHSEVAGAEGPYDPYTYNLYSVKRLHVEMPDGSTHEFRADDSVVLCGNTSTGCPADQTGIYLSVDGTKMRLEINQNGTAVLYLPDGSFYGFEPFDYTVDTKGHQARSYTDRNGNKMTYSPTSRQWTDTLGRVITNPLPINWQTGQEQTVGDVTASFPGINGGSLNATFSWRYLKDPNGGESGLNDPNQTLHYSSSIGCQGNVGRSIPQPHLFTSGIPVRVCHPISFSGLNNWTAGPPFNPVVLTKITLANGQSYQFKYNVYGEIEKIIYPSGGYERFAYARIQPVQHTENSYEQANRGVTDRWVSAKGDGTDEQHWTYSVTREFYPTPIPYTVTTINPDGTKTEQLLYDEKDTNKQRPFGFDDQKTGRPYETRFYSASSQLLRRTLTAYEVTEVTTGSTAGTSVQATRDIRPVKEISLTFEPGAGSALAALSETVYDTNGDPAFFAALNPKQSRSYHYVAVDLNTAQTGDINAIAALFSGSNLAQVSEMDYLYDGNYKARNIVTLPTVTRVKDAAGNTVAQSQVEYDQAAYGILSAGTDAQWVDPNTSLRGNPTTSRAWTDVAANSYVETHQQFDNFGNLRKAWDARGVLSEVEYSSTYKYAYPTKTISTAPDPSGQNGSSTAFESTSVYDANTSLVLSTTDANGQTSQMEYNDALLRPTKVIPPSGGAQTVMEYTDTPGAIKVTTKTQIDAGNWAESTVYADGLGRTVKTEKKDDAGNVFAETEYDSMGRVKRVTNPYRNGETKLWTESTYDDLSRVTKVVTPDNAEVTTAYGLSTSGSLATVVTVTDQANKQRRSLTNSLGQLVRVDEPDDVSGTLGDPSVPNQPTSYGYDTLNNLTTVNQGVQTRTFQYDSLSRLKQATNPESGTISYSYDAGGNLTAKTDARSITTNYAYDNLNRVITRSYTGNATPTVTYNYDGTGLSAAAANAKGKLTRVSSSVSETKYNSFDSLGRILSSQQITDGQTYNFGYAYNLAGMLVEETYPSGRKVRNSFATDGDLSKVETMPTGGSYATRADNFSYTATGAVSQMQLGNARWENAQFNSRLQPVQLGLGTSAADMSLWKVAYEYGSTDNNGNVKKQTIIVPSITPLEQDYTYDSLNRLKSATEKIQNSSETWKQTFTYDRYGNRNFDSGNTTTIPTGCPAAQCNPQINQSNNRFATNQGYDYDAAGNLTADAQTRSFVYDAENKQREVKNASNVLIGQYFYDGDGKRVKKVSTAETTLFAYDASGKLAAEYTLTSATPQTATTSYLTSDTLGSPRVITDMAGNVTSRRDFMPFGEEIAGLGNRTSTNGYQADSTRQKFTGYERDSESELDFAQARYYNQKHGRFTGVDPILSSATIYDPQTWNRYSYTLNSPLKYTDPFGMYICDGDKKQCQNIEDGLKKGQEALKKLDPKSEQYKLLNRALSTYGKAGVDNGLMIKFGATTKGAPAETGGLIREDKTNLGNKLVTADNPTGRDITVTFDPKQHDSITDYATNLAHEGSHAADRTDFIAALPLNLGSAEAQEIFESSSLNPTPYDTETTAYRVSAAVSQGLGYDSLRIGKNKIEIWNSGWKQSDLAAGRSKQGVQIDKVLAEPKSKGGLYEITRENPGKKTF